MHMHANYRCDKCDNEEMMGESNVFVCGPRMDSVIDWIVSPQIYILKPQPPM